MRAVGGRHLALLGAACAAGSAAAAVEYEVAPGSSASAARRRVVLRPWAAARLLGGANQPTGRHLALLRPELADHFTEQWGDQQLPVPQAGSMQVAWSPGCLSGPNALPPPARAALESAARRAAAAFAGEAAASGGAYGRAAQEQGWHIEVVPSPHFYCGTASRCIVLTTAAIAACWQDGAGSSASSSSSSGAPAPTPVPGAAAAAEQRQQRQQQEQAEAALLFLLGHEMGHGLGRHTEEKASHYSFEMLGFAWRYTAAEWRHRLRRWRAGSGGSSGGGSRAAAAEEAWLAESAALKLRLAASLQWISWQHELEADALACSMMGRAGVPRRQWPARLQLLQRVAEQEAGGAQHAACSSGWDGGGGNEGCQGAATREAVLALAEEQEAAAHLEAAATLAADISSQLAVGEHSAAQRMLDSYQRWPVPAGWLAGMELRQQAKLVASLAWSHPPLATRERRVWQLAT